MKNPALYVNVTGELYQINPLRRESAYPGTVAFSLIGRHGAEVIAFDKHTGAAACSCDSLGECCHEKAIRAAEKEFGALLRPTLSGRRTVAAVASVN